ncbi:inorganic phosphate transporter [Chitinilyticum piscinae]|uniref:Phosphate transporter n=1 Tax=Chitinilyticum piscinae TaxID=2866724 RepID=A0A8J7FMD6_9NEIS|nr:inorganic phosphate transporter [Chitinilyticum piscinae]MBE9610632.1 inorganic phosphate transporter [Chitinilyticum piscinae]
MNHLQIDKLHSAAQSGHAELIRLGIALLFIVGIIFYTALRGAPPNIMLIVAAVIGAYMAMNIGANDVANNVGPAVGSGALTMGGALIIAGIFEAAGALIAGGEVVSTIRSGIINPALIPDLDTFIWIMMAALLAGALWLNVATAVGAPVSTTHSIVGAVLGAGVAAGGFGIADWAQVGTIAASWLISPLLGGVFAALFLYLIKRTITYRQDMVHAATAMVPLLVGVMAWTFTTYLILKGLSKVWQVGFLPAMLYGLLVGVLVMLLLRPLLKARQARISNTKQSVNTLFTVPLIFAAALLSFAHGANDVANAIGPLAAINDALTSAGEVHGKAEIPLWVMMIGALGIAIGLALYGPKVIRTVGSEITELDQMRAFCIALAATITVIVASQLGLPVSSTHIAVGGVFGVGFLREYLKANHARIIDEIKTHHPEDDQAAIDVFMARFNTATIQQKGQLLAELKEQARQQLDPAHFSKMERKHLKKVYRQELVKRSQIMKIVAAWVITLPASAVMAALVFFTLRGMLLA